MNDKNTNMVEERNEISYFDPEMRSREEFEEENKYSSEERNESEEMYMISTILTSDF